jgi:hypothetical protein
VTRRLAVILALAAITASGCPWVPELAGPPPGYRLTLVDFLQHATLDPAPANATVVALIYTLPQGSSATSSLEVRAIQSGKLPPWTTIHPMSGTQALARQGLYVGVFSVSTGKIRYLSRVADPRDVRGEALTPGGDAVLTRLSSGTYSVRAPFISDALAVGFEVDAKGAVTRVDFYLPFGSAVPDLTGTRFWAVHD